MSHTRAIRLLAYNIRSLWNVGAFFRTCDALNVEKLILAGYTGQPPRKEIAKVALGADDTVPWEHHEDPLQVMQQHKEEGWQIVALELTPDSVPLQELKAADKVLLVVGHELTGVPSEQLALCDAVTCIPMLGHKESLNVAVATGMALYRFRFLD